MIKILNKAFEKMVCYTYLAHHEILWIGRMTKDFCIFDVEIFEQNVTCSYCELVNSKSQEYDKFVGNYDVFLWGHSHHRHGIFFSGLDIADSVRHRKCYNLVVEQVMNQHGGCRFDLVQFKGSKVLRTPDLAWEVLDGPGLTLEERFDIAKKVTKLCHKK